MADILQCYDLNRASTSRKMPRKIRADGFEAPRNSLEFPTAASHAFYKTVMQNPSKIGYSYRGTTMKKLIDDEISNQPNERRNSPSVVARLMGMDAIPAGKDAVVHAKEIKVQKAGTSVVRMNAMDSAAGQRNSPKLAPFKQSKCNLLSYSSKQEASLSWKQRSTRPQPREHPQEELLQKFKKDFEAWQTSKLLEKSMALVVENSLSKGKYIQILAQENLNKEKMARYVNTKKILAQKKVLESNEVALISHLKPDTQQEGDSKCQSHVSLQHEMDVIGAGSVNNCKQLQVAKVANKHERSHSPTRIIILKPSCERRINTEESWVGSSEAKKDCNMEDFLEEVKERLKCEIKGKARSNSSTKGSQTESPFRERSTDPKQVAHNIAKHIRESVTRDIGWKMMRSESNRSSMRGFQINGTEPEQIIKRDTRRILSDRVKDVCKNEVDPKESIINDEMSGDSYFIKSKGRVKSMTDIPNIAWEDKKTMSESMLRHKKDNILLFNSQVASPRNLARSFSAPVPRSAFGKLLLEDQHILSGAHIRRKRETSETTSKEVKKNMRDSFNLKGRVSCLKQNFTLKGKLFGKRIHSSKKSTAGETNSMKIIRTIPLAILNRGIMQPQDNYTEVPPTPASVSSSSHNEYCTPDNPSPVSPLDVQPSRQSCGDLICNFPELSQSEDFKNEESEEVTIEEKYYKDEITEIENPDEAYIKDILVTAGLYEDRSFDQANPRWDALRSPISYKILEEVEEAYSRYKKVDNEDSFLDHCDTSLSHRLLFDLLNEALQSIGSIPRNNVTVTRWILDSAAVPRGKKLLDELWHHIQCYTNLPMDEMHTIDSMVARDVRMTRWPTTLYEDIDVSCRKVECAILGELIDDFVQDICF